VATALINAKKPAGSRLHANEQNGSSKVNFKHEGLAIFREQVELEVTQTL
jgi:hypothetical protein